MSDDKLDLKINLDIATHGADKLDKQRKEFAQLEAELLAFARAAKAASSSLSSLGKGKTGATGTADDVRNGRTALDLDRARYGELKRIFVFQRRMASQEKREKDDIARQLKAQERERENALKAQAKLATRAARERAKAEAEAEKRIRDEIRETTRLRDRENRKAAQDADRLRRAQERAAERAARGASQVRSGAGRVAQTGAAAAAVMGYGAARAIQRGVHTRAEADEAETNIRIFNDTDDGKGGRRKLNGDDIRKLRRGPDGLDQLAVNTGTSVPETLRAYNESAKAGLIDPMAQTRNVLKAGAALELDPSKTTKLLGTLARNMGAAGTPDRLYRTLNAVGIGAREDPTQSNEIIEGLNRSQGLLSMSKGFTPEDLVAMVSGGQSVGIQPGKAGTAITALGRSILQGGNRFLDQKKRKELNFAAKHLGFGSAKNMAEQFAGENGKAVYYQIMTGLKGMAPQLRQQVADALSGGQWSDEDLQIVNGIDGQIKTDKEIHDPRNANFIDEAAAEKMKSWKMLWAQSQTIFSLFWESFGVGFDGVLREINAFFLDLNGKFDYDAVSQYVRDALDGLREGLGLQTWKEGLEAIFPSDISGLGDKIKDFARGFGEGVKAIGSTLRTIGSAFGIGGGAEALGSMSAKFLLLSTACIALSPVLGILGGLASVVLGLASVTRAAASVLGLGGGAAAAGGVGGGAVAGALASVARILSGSFIVSLAGAIGNMRGEISTMILSAVRPLVEAIWTGLKQAFSWEGVKSGGAALLNEIVPAPLQRWLKGGKAVPNQGTDQSSKPWVDPPLRKPVERLTESLDQTREVMKEGAKVQRQSFEAIEGLDRSLIHKASLSSAAGAISDSIRSTAARAGGGVLSGSVGSSDGPALNHSTPGGSLSNGLTGMRRRGIMGGGGSGGGGSSSPAPEGSSEPIPGTLNPRLAGSRKALMDELDQNPALRRDVFKTISMENRGSPLKMQTVLESMVNRAKMNGYTSLNQAIHSGFYGPVNRGGLRGALSDKDRRDGEAALAQVKAGSNVIGYRTDQGMLTDPGARRYMREADHSGHRVIGGENYFYMGQKGRAWARQQELEDARQGSPAVAGAQGSVARTGELARNATPRVPPAASQSAPVGGSNPAGAGGAGLGDAAPGRTLGSDAPLSSRSGAGASMSYGRTGHNISAPITINGHNKDPEELANTVQRKLQDSMNRRTHDYDGFS